MMPKPNHSSDNCNGYNNTASSHERTIFETKPNIILYSNNFILKIVVLLLLLFFFSPLIALFYGIQSNLLDTFQLNFANLTFIMELILIFCILIVIIKIILDILDWNYTLYTLSYNHIKIQRGFFRKEEIIMTYSKIQDIEVSQTIMERLLNAGDIIVYGGHDNSETILDEVPNPKKVENLIIDCMNGNISNNRNNNQNYNPNYNQNRNYQPNYQDNYNNQNRNYSDGYCYENDGYTDNEYYDENKHSHTQDIHKYNKYKKGRSDKRKYNKSQIDEDEIISKHQKRFKKYKE